MAERSRPAVFLDRDGTIVDDPGFLHRAADVRLLPGAAAAIARLNAAGWPVVVVTNQSGIARGLYDVAAYESVQRRLDDLLEAAGARVDATYFCPHHPDFTGPCDCRKPGTALFQRAAKDLHLDLTRSWFVGDRDSDVEPANALGGKGILLGGSAARRLDLAGAVDLILGDK